MYRGWNRNVHIAKHLLTQAAAIKPSMLCQAGNSREFEQWKERFKAKLDELLSPWPKRLPHNGRTIARAVREHDIVEKFVIDVQEGLSAPGYLLIPKDYKRGQKRPAILCFHGHGEGKSRPVGISPSEFSEQVSYAAVMARQGYVTAVIDCRGFGERALPMRTSDTETKCNYLYLLYAMLGYQLITLHIHDQMQALDYLLSRPEVDPDRVGGLGKSFGGAMSQYVSVFDERIKAAAIACYMTSTIEYTFEDINNNCGSQFVPGLYQYGDVATVAGLIAPRPLLVQSGIADDCFGIEGAGKAHDELRSIYSAAGAKDRLTIDVFEGGHEFHPQTAIEFFDKYLGPAR